ncbi:MAG: type II toxin-antitoxin system HicB family antitoxin [Caldilineaceae bacterium]|nr:type II toxin-antitoxin system HicB family antitoxin [Caldilineaceae bacterium]
MNYRGYTADIRYDERDRIFWGHLLGTFDDVYFEGTSVEELETAFHEAVDDYLTYCEETGREPTRVESGQTPSEISVRVNKELQYRTFVAAQQSGVSLDDFVEDALNRALQEST